MDYRYYNKLDARGVPCYISLYNTLNARGVPRNVPVRSGNSQSGRNYPNHPVSSTIFSNSEKQLLTEEERANHLIRESIFSGELTRSKLKQQYQHLDTMLLESAPLKKTLYEHVENYTSDGKFFYESRLRLLVISEDKRLTKIENREIIEQKPQVDQQLTDEYKQYFEGYKYLKEQMRRLNR
jgi:hypothetical protein